MSESHSSDGSRWRNLAALLFRIITMTQQAINSMKLYKGNNPATIRQMLAIQKTSVVEELKKHFGARDLDELAVKLSIGK